MSAHTWRKPLLPLRTDLYQLFKSGGSLYHAGFLFPDRSRLADSDVEFVMTHSEAAFTASDAAFTTSGLVSKIELPSKCNVDVIHAMFAENKSAGYATVTRLKECLQGIEGWLNKVPKSILQPIDLSHCPNRDDRDLAIWIAAVFQLASKLDSAYLGANFDLWVGGRTFETWDLYEDRDDFDPLSVFSHHKTQDEVISKWQNETAREASPVNLPLSIGAYLAVNDLIIDFVRASVAAIDALLFVFPLELEDRVGQRRSRSTRSRGRIQEKQIIDYEVKLLKEMLRLTHMPDSGEGQSTPMTWKEIRSAMNWKHSQSTIWRRITAIFPDGKDEYEAWVQGGCRTPRRGFASRDDESGSITIDASIDPHAEEEEDYGRLGYLEDD